MPVICIFAGIKISMFYNDHTPPHFHADYAERRALISIEEGCVIRGSLPSRQLKFVLAWAEFHKDELMQNWELARMGEPLVSIDPLFVGG